MCQSTAVVPFQFQTSQIRAVAHEGEHWFVAKDVCDVLDIANTTDALKSLDEDERSRFNLGRQGSVNIVNESGLYALIFKSRKPDARQFRKWVTGEVLPALRKTGRYAAAAGHRAAGRRFIAAIDHEGRMSMTELDPDDIVVRPKNLARMIADPTVRFAEDANEHLRALAEIATAATIRAHYNASVAREMLFDGPHARRAAELLASRGKA